MEYSIEGDTLPVVILYLQPNETVITQNGGMSWRTDNVKLKTAANGILSAAGRMFAGEKFFQNRYTAHKTSGFLAVASSFPGKIIPFRIQPGEEIILQKKAFLCSEANVKVSLYMQQKVRSGLFSGEGFALQKLSGYGMAFAEMDGYVKRYDLQAKEKLVMETGCLAAVSASCSIDIQGTGGVKNYLLSGEGLFNTTVTGPGSVWVQSMPLRKLKSSLGTFRQPTENIN